MHLQEETKLGQPGHWRGFQFLKFWDDNDSLVFPINSIRALASVEVKNRSLKQKESNALCISSIPICQRFFSST